MPEVLNQLNHLASDPVTTTATAPATSPSTTTTSTPSSLSEIQLFNKQFRSAAVISDPTLLQQPKRQFNNLHQSTAAPTTTKAIDTGRPKPKTHQRLTPGDSTCNIYQSGGDTTRDHPHHHHHQHSSLVAPAAQRALRSSQLISSALPLSTTLDCRTFATSPLAICLPKATTSPSSAASSSSAIDLSAKATQYTIASPRDDKEAALTVLASEPTGEQPILSAPQRSAARVVARSGGVNRSPHHQRLHPHRRQNRHHLSGQQHRHSSPSAAEQVGAENHHDHPRGRGKEESAKNIRRRVASRRRRPQHKAPRPAVAGSHQVLCSKPNKETPDNSPIPPNNSTDVNVRLHHFVSATAADQLLPQGKTSLPHSSRQQQQELLQQNSTGKQLSSAKPNATTSFSPLSGSAMFHHYAASPTGGPSHFHDPPPQLQHARLPARAATTLDLSTTAATSKTLSGATEVAKPLVGFSPNNLQYPGPPLGSGTTSLQQLNAEYPLFHGGRNRLSSTIATPMTKTTMRVPATDAYLPVTSTTSLATTSCKATPMVYQSPAGNMSPTVSVNNRFPRANYQQEHHHHHHQYHNQHYYHPPPHTSSPTTPKHLTTSTTGTGSYLLLSNPPPVSSASRSATAPPRQTSSSSPSSRNRYLQQQQNVRHRSPDLSPAVTVAAPSSLRHAYQPFPTTTTTRTVSAASPVAKDSHAGGNRSPSASHLYHQQLPATFSPTMTANYQPQQHQYHQNVPRNNVMHPTFDSFEAPDRSHQQIRHHLQAGTAPTPQQECIAQPQTLLPTSPSDRLLMLSRQSQSPSRPSRLPCSPVPPHSAAPSPPKLLPASTTASRGPPGQQSMPARPFNLPSDNLAPTRASAERRLRTFPSPSPSSVSSSAKPQVRHQSQQARLLSGSTNTTPASGAIRQLSEGAVFSSPSTVMMPSSSRMADFTGSIRMWMPDGALQSTLPSSTTQGGQLRMKSFPANSVGRYSGSVGIKFTGKAFRTALPRPAGAMTTAIGQSPLPSGGIAGARVQPPLAGGEAADGPSAASAEGGKRTVGGPIGGGGGGASGHTTSPTTAGGRSGGIGCRTANGKNNEDADGSGGEAMWVTPRFDCAASFVDCEVSPAARGKSPSAVAGPEEVRSTSGDFRNGDETDVQQLRQSLRDGDVDDNGAGKRDLTPSPMVHAPMDGGGSESQKAEIGVAEEVVMRRPAAGAGPDDRIRQKQHHRVHRGSSGDVTTTGESTSAASAQTTVPPAAGGVVASESASAQQKVEQPVAAMEGTKAVGGGQTTSSGAAEASSSSSSSFGGHEGSEWLDGVVRQIADSYRLDAEEAEKLAALLDANFIRGPAALAQSAANKRLHSLVHPVLADGLLLLLAPPETTQAEEAEREQLRVVDGETNDRDGFASPSASRDQETTKDADVVSTAVRQPNDTTAASTSSTGSTTGRGKGTSTTSTGVALAADRKGQHEEEEEDEGGNFETFMSSLGEREDDAMDDATNEESVPFLDATAVGSFQFVDASSSPLPTAERERMMSSPHQLTGGGDDDEGRRGFAGWRRALAENLGARDTQAKARGARRFELVSNREWIIENVRGSEVLEINGAEMRHNVSVRDCADGCFVKVNNKVNQIYVDRCNKTSILFNTLLGSIELINSNKIRVQVVEKCPSITIDACNGVHIYLSEASKDTIITTAKSSEVNVAFPLDEPGPDGGVDFKDSPIPEQFKTTIEKERLVTEVAQWH